MEAKIFWESKENDIKFSTEIFIYVQIFAYINSMGFLYLRYTLQNNIYGQLFEH